MFTNGKQKEADELTGLMISKCETVNVKRTLYIDRISLVYEIDKNDETYRLTRPSFEGLAENYMYSKISLNCQCDPGLFILTIRWSKSVLSLQ